MESVAISKRNVLSGLNVQVIGNGNVGNVQVIGNKGK